MDMRVGAPDTVPPDMPSYLRDERSRRPAPPTISRVEAHDETYVHPPPPLNKCLPPLLLLITACVEPQTSPMASELQSDAPIAEAGHDPKAPRAWNTRNPCHFVWHELPFDDDSIVEHRVDTYFARVYTQPLNKFPHPGTLEQAVDLLIGGGDWMDLSEGLRVLSEAIPGRCSGVGRGQVQP